MTGETAKVAFSVRLTPQLAGRLRAAAQDRGVSMTSLVESACEQSAWGRVPAARCPVHRTPTRGGACQECDGGLY